MKNNMDMEPLPGDIRMLILFYVQDVKHRLEKIEELLAEEEEQHETGTD